MNANWPSVTDYADWAREQGCTVTFKPIERDGRSLQIVTIVAVSGAAAIEVVMEPGDPLMSTTIARLDRRLGMKSHLFR